jgi:hypothetical protein
MVHPIIGLRPQWLAYILIPMQSTSHAYTMSLQ